MLYLVKEGLLDAPVLYLSSHIVRTKADYYRLLQSVRDGGTREEWVLYMLEAVEQTPARRSRQFTRSRTHCSTTSTASVPDSSFTAKT